MNGVAYAVWRYCLVACIVTIVGSVPSWADERVPLRELVVLTWTDYIDPAVVAEFEQRFNANVKFFYFESDDDRDDLLVQSNGLGYDLVLADGISVTEYAKFDWLMPLTEADIPNVRHVDARWRRAFPKTYEYGVPYFWSTIGIAYRRDLVAEPLARWMDLFKPQPALHGKILMIKHGRDVIGMALKTLGYSQNSEDVDALAQAQQLLLGQKPHVKGYSYVAITERSALLSGDVVAAMVFNGDGVALHKLNPNIEFVVPAEGTNLGVDYFTVTKSSPNKDLAKAFINFINEPENAARIATFVHFPTPNKAAAKLLRSDHLANTVIYPDTKTLERSEFLTELTPVVTKHRNEIFQRLLQ